MKSHSLMQAIARANRVYPGKPYGIIVDYVNVFKYMKQALSDYAIPDDDSIMPAKDIDQLISLLDSCISEGDEFLQNLEISLDKIIGESATFDKLDALRSWRSCDLKFFDNVLYLMPDYTRTVICCDLKFFDNVLYWGERKSFPVQRCDLKFFDNVLYFQGI